MAAKKGVVAAVRRDLVEFGRRDSRLADSGLAALALALAEQMDDPENSATSKSMCAKSLLDTMAQLRALAPPENRKDKLDELASRREKRVSAAKG